MSLPSLDTIIAYTTICFAIVGALVAALWISLIIWTFRDMRSRSRDPFAQILSALVVAFLPIVGFVVYLILRPPETLADGYERALEEEALLQQIEERPACPGCSRTVDPNWLVCPHCHTRLKKACPDCNSLMDLQWNLCPYCGNHHIDPYQVGPPVVLAEDIINSGELSDEDRSEESSFDETLQSKDGLDGDGREGEFDYEKDVDVPVNESETYSQDVSESNLDS